VEAVEEDSKKIQVMRSRKRGTIYRRAWRDCMQVAKAWCRAVAPEKKRRRGR
jgi:hypothetical protein